MCSCLFSLTRIWTLGWGSILLTVAWHMAECSINVSSAKELALTAESPWVNLPWFAMLPLTLSLVKMLTPNYRNKLLRIKSSNTFTMFPTNSVPPWSISNRNINKTNLIFTGLEKLNLFRQWRKATRRDCVLCPWHIWVVHNSLNPTPNSGKKYTIQRLLLLSFYGRKTWSLEKLSNFLKGAEEDVQLESELRIYVLQGCSLYDHFCKGSNSFCECVFRGLDASDLFFKRICPDQRQDHKEGGKFMASGVCWVCKHALLQQPSLRPLLRLLFPAQTLSSYLLVSLTQNSLEQPSLSQACCKSASRKTQCWDTGVTILSSLCWEARVSVW